MYLNPTALYFSINIYIEEEGKEKESHEVNLKRQLQQCFYFLITIFFFLKKK